MKKRAWMKFGLLMMLILLVVVLQLLFDVGQFLSFERLQFLIDGAGVWAPALFILLYIVATVFFLPGTPLSIAGGVLFGGFWGVVYVVIGATIGASIAFWFARFMGRDFVQGIVLKRYPKLSEYDDSFEQNGFLTVLFLRLIPLVPFNGFNLFAGVTKVSFHKYVLGTFLGIIPGSFVLVNIGANITNISSPLLYIFIALFILMAASPKIYKKWKQRV